MGRSKEQFANQRQMEVLCVMHEEDYKSLTPTQREQMLHVEFNEHNEYETHKGDSIYMELYKKSRKAKKELRDYLFDKRFKK